MTPARTTTGKTKALYLDFDSVEFHKQEVAYYAAIAVLGCLGSLCRSWRDGDRDDWRRVVGRILAGGIFSFGGVGLWIGRDPGGISGPAYFMAVAALVGFYSKDIQSVLDAAATTIIRKILEKWTGLEVEPEDDATTEERDR